jgi:hypothetical protein
VVLRFVDGLTTRDVVDELLGAVVLPMRDVVDGLPALDAVDWLPAPDVVNVADDGLRAYSEASIFNASSPTSLPMSGVPASLISTMSRPAP